MNVHRMAQKMGFSIANITQFNAPTRQRKSGTCIIKNLGVKQDVNLASPLKQRRKFVMPKKPKLKVDF